jgi:osmotically-inducible protein OsmY
MSASPVTAVQPRASAALAASPVHELRELRVEPRNGSLLISGRVSSFYHKQLAQEAVRAVCREVEIVNAVCVEDGEGEP